MSQIVPFDGNSLPAYLKTAAPDYNADLAAHAGTGFPVISIKGKQFAVVRDGVRKILPNPKDPDSPATYIDAVIIKANKTKSKVFYLKGYDPKESDGKKPDCFSNDGTKPDPSAEHPQSKLCVTCPHAQWGAKISEHGKKMKACQDSVRMAVAAPSALNDPMLLRVPPASIKALGELAQLLAKRGNVPYNAVVTRISFDAEAESPKLVLKPFGFLTEADHKAAEAMVDSDIVASILGTVASPAEEVADAPTEAEVVIAKAASPEPVSRSKVVTAEEIEERAPKSEAAPAPKKAKPAPAPEPEVDTDDLNLDEIDFDD